MTLWLAFALMTAAAIFAVLWPLSRRVEARGGSDLAVYRDQLDEIARDRAAGLIGEREAEAAKVEVSRRLIAAADAADMEPAVTGTAPLWRRRATAVAALVLLPLGAAAFYLSLGSPQIPGAPLAERMAQQANQSRSIASMVSQVEAHLERNPNDARGYEVLAPVYMRLGRFADAVTARRKVIALAGDSAQRQSDLGEALAAASNGIVTEEAKAAFDQALKLDSNDLKARFFLGIAAEQDGDKTKAASIWRGMLDGAPADAPWTAMVREALARVGGSAPATAPGPSTADINAAAGMNEQDRGEMVRGMVARLADRLKQNGDDIDGWQRLMRAYIVLGERDKAQAAAGDAKRAFASDPEKLKRIEDTIKEMGLEG
ncbi:c-type cytochrome biogenesis protein CcmI [Pseudolabrys taiwanensis]|uniref:C-type cytochrome biogenesis protein CcmI n=1 Tax=Pseudolabrys taiwanensis TaxID=331696 RepID=A0A345ZV47_9HYPH|nr:c-type cytochrome biogenesis protein CcmI [Pseudolabrys taiwanensis]AXK80794.1 c-type cytochrome biogenesis protein CcmI [Pseudolabrys taiwanensis]